MIPFKWRLGVVVGSRFPLCDCMRIAVAGLGSTLFLLPLALYGWLYSLLWHLRFRCLVLMFVVAACGKFSCRGCWQCTGKFADVGTNWHLFLSLNCALSILCAKLHSFRPLANLKTGSIVQMFILNVIANLEAIFAIRTVPCTTSQILFCELHFSLLCHNAIQKHLLFFFFCKIVCCQWPSTRIFLFLFFFFFFKFNLFCIFNEIVCG